MRSSNRHSKWTYILRNDMWMRLNERKRRRRGRWRGELACSLNFNFFKRIQLLLKQIILVSRTVIRQRWSVQYLFLYFRKEIESRNSPWNSAKLNQEFIFSLVLCYSFVRTTVQRVDYWWFCCDSDISIFLVTKLPPSRPKWLPKTECLYRTECERTR